MNVYAVFKQGVYRHQCGGVTSDKRKAIRWADELAAADIDSYHEYEVVPFVLGQRAALFNADYRGLATFAEAEPIYTTRKPGERRHG